MRPQVTFSVLILVLFIAFFGQKASAQEVLDGAYIEEHQKTRQVIRHPHLREADVMWEKRVWRQIDTKQKLNLPLFYPLEEIKDRKSLWQVIVEGLKEGSLTAYRSGPDNTTDDFSGGTFQWAAFKNDVIQDSCNLQEEERKVPYHTSARDVRRYRLKEIWYFDKQRSVMDVKIIGISPFLIKTIPPGCRTKGQPALEMTGTKFWLYYPECRYVFQNYEAFNMVGSNKSEMRSFDDIFIKRRFDSYIIKESNVYDRNIGEYKNDDLDALLEAKKIKNELFRIEHDLWSY